MASFSFTDRTEIFLFTSPVEVCWLEWFCFDCSDFTDCTECFLFASAAEVSWLLWGGSSVSEVSEPAPLLASSSIDGSEFGKGASSLIIKIPSIHTCIS